MLKCSANLTYAIFLEAPEMQGMKVVSNLVMFIALLLSNQILAEDLAEADTPTKNMILPADFKLTAESPAADSKFLWTILLSMAILVKEKKLQAKFVPVVIMLMAIALFHRTQF